MKKETIVDEITLGEGGKIIAMKGRVISRKKIYNLDNACYHSMLSELGIEEMI